MIIKRKKLYYVSPLLDLNSKIIMPKKPSSMWSKHGIEDDKISRISIYPTIEGALSSFFGQDLSGMRMAVYTLIGVDEESLIYPGTDQIPTAKMTGVVWSIKPLRLIKDMEIDVSEIVGEKRFTYGPKAEKGILNEYKWEKVDNRKDYKDQLYHISEEKNLKILTPRIPDNYFTENGYEDNTTKRVCLSTSISGALAGLGMNLEGKVLTVYKPEDKIITKKPNKKQVPDIEITDEVWYTGSDIRIVPSYIIKVLGAIGPGIEFNYGNKKAKLYNWDYKILKRL